MNRYLVPASILLALALLAGCAVPGSTPTANQDTHQVSVSILPQAWFVEKIGGDLVQVQSLMGTGDDPHTYEPSPSQMTSLANTDIYFTIGVEFETAWMDRLVSASPGMRIIDSAAGIVRIPSAESHIPNGAAHDEEHEDDHDHDHAGEPDPHVWFSSANARIIARNIAAALAEIDPQNKPVYDANLAALLADIDETDVKIRTMLADINQHTFLVMHPAWGYFADEYGLIQVSVEVGGDEPTPGSMAALEILARQTGATTLFAQKNSNLRLAQTIAEQAGIPNLVEWDPLAYAWDENMLNIAADLQLALK